MSEADVTGARRAISDAIDAAIAGAEAIGDNGVAYDQVSWLTDKFGAAVSEAARARGRIAARIRDAEGLNSAQLARRLGISRQHAGRLLRGSVPPAEPKPVAAAIITSALGVLLAHRHDGSPPWTFPAGEIEPGESAAEAAAREVLEETGVPVKVGREIGRRVHPASKRTMIYLAATPVGELDVKVGDPLELADVRWVSLSEADELMPGMFAPVRAYAAARLRRTSAS